MRKKYFIYDVQMLLTIKDICKDKIYYHKSEQPT